MRNKGKPSYLLVQTFSKDKNLSGYIYKVANHNKFNTERAI